MSDQSSFVDGLNDAIRENPLAATLVGAGVFWMLFGAAKPFSAAAVTGTADLIKRKADSTTRNVRSRAMEATNYTKHNAREIADTVKDYYADASETVADGARSAADVSRHYGSAIQASLHRNLESQPLMLGALGLAIGAGIASAFPATNLENDVMGDSAVAAREKIETVAKDVLDSAASRGEKLMEDLKDETSAQGLAPADARRAWGQVAGKASAVADAAKNSLNSNLQSTAETESSDRR